MLRCTGAQFRVTKFCTVTPNICGPSVWNLIHFTLVAQKLSFLLDFWKIRAPLHDVYERVKIKRAFISHPQNRFTEILF